jgi:hypothetical protein
MSVSTFVLTLTLAVDIFAAGLADGLAGLPRGRWFTMALIFSFFSTCLLFLELWLLGGSLMHLAPPLPTLPAVSLL